MDADFDKLMRQQSAQLFEDYKAPLMVRYKTKEDAIDGVYSAIKKSLSKYVGAVVTPELKEQIQKDLQRTLWGMVTN